MFKNEYVPPLDQEACEFCRWAREILRTGYSRYDSWTVDRERQMVLFHRGAGHSIEAAGEDYWTFLTAGQVIFADTELLASRTTADGAIEMTRSLSFQGDLCKPPSAETVAWIKEALRERGRRHMFDLEAYARCDLKLIDARTHQEL